MLNMSTQLDVDLTIGEKRDLLELVRIKFGFETKVPRDTAVDRICEKALLESSPERPLSVADVCETLQQRGVPLRNLEVKQSLERLKLRGRAATIPDSSPTKFFLTEETATGLHRELGEAHARIQRVVAKLYSGVAVDPRKLRRFFLRVLSDVFSQFGKEWVGVCVGRLQLADVFNADRMKRILTNAAVAAQLERQARKVVFSRTMGFFKDQDPDFHFLKFTMGQSYFIAHLLAIDTAVDPLSAEAFANSVFYLDTNVIISALLPGARRFRAFQELVAVCRRLGITLLVAEPSYRETQAVVAFEQNEVAKMYDEVPPQLVEKTFGAFFQTYIAGKRDDPSFSVQDVFKPFADLRKTLLEKYNVEVVDSRFFDRVDSFRDLGAVEKVLAEKSLLIRRRRKGPAALRHDASLFLFLREERESNSKTRLLTLDRSLPPSGAELQPNLIPFGMTLDGFLQSLSPFVSAETELDFATVFSQIIDSQIFPPDAVYDIRDYLIFDNIGLSCRDMEESDVDEVLHLIKTKVPRGDHYTKEDFKEASYQFRRFFTKRYLEKENLLAEKEREIERIGREHAKEKEQMSAKSEQILADKASEIADLRKDLEGLRTQIEKRNIRTLKLVRRLKWLLVVGFPVGLAVAITILAIIYGEGKNPLQKVKDFWPFYALVPVLAQILLGWLLPDKDFLRKLLGKS
jgi:hypothetical protein